ncbi:MAG TPA: class IV adenylate cyclase [Pyrinomonadaceae bacterium]|nr:class IV adenylate cyclase [Pyrinomonadaceae bacterium]
MGTEVEKKYRVTAGEREALVRRLEEVGGVREGGEEFEENTLYSGHGLDPRTRVLRLRRVGGRAVFTFKERGAETANPVKRHREEETEVGDGEALAAILEALGYRPALVYEKRRATWRVRAVEVVIDELPFGLFVEIEGEEDDIHEAERLLRLTDARPEHSTYPDLASRHGRHDGGSVEARFEGDGQRQTDPERTRDPAGPHEM